MSRLLACSLALGLLLAAAGCEFLPRSPVAELEAPPPMPEPETSWLDLGRKLLAADQPDQARDAFIRSLRVEGVTAAALTGAGVAAEQQGMLTEARRHFEAARRRAPRSVTAHLNLGAVLYRMGELRAARRAFEAALKLSGGASEAAARNIAISEAAIRRAETAAAGNTDATPPELNPRWVERVGPTRYRLSGLLQIQEDG
jgi:tetratricopeptide (TPR) repeat protein